MRTRVGRLALAVAVAAGVWAAVGAVVRGEEAKPAVVGRWYSWQAGEKAAGYFHVTRRASGDRAAPVLLEHEFVVQARGKRLSLQMQTFCQDDDWLIPVRIISKGEGDDELGTFTATIVRTDAGRPSAGKLTATREGGRRVTLDLPERTTTDFAVFEIVRALPFDKEKVLEFNCLEASELNLKSAQRLAYLGEETVSVRGEARKLHKFEQTGGGINPIHYWVDEKHELVRIVMDDSKEFLLGTEQESRRALAGP